MDVNQMYRVWLLAINKNLQQGYGSPDDFYVTINQAQRSYEDYLLGEYQKYQIRRPVSVVEIGQNERITDSLSPLIYGIILNINPSGVAPKPSDYEYVNAMFSVYGNYNIRFTQEDRKDSYIHSEIDPISENPVYLIEHEGFRYHPARPFGENQAFMSYIRNAPSIVWGWVPDSNGIPTYNPATSQNPVWSETDCLQIITRALLLMGVSLQFNTVLQYANDVKNNGQ